MTGIDFIRQACRRTGSFAVNTLFVLILFILLPNQAIAKDYFVDKNNIGGVCNDSAAGTLKEPWCTINKANSTLQTGDSVNIRSGIYNETIEPHHSGRPQNPIVYRSFPGEQVIIRGTPGTFEVVNIGGFNTDWQPKSYIIIDGLRIERGYPELVNSSRHTLITIYGEKSSHNEILNCTLSGTDEPLLTVWKNGEGLRVGGISISKSSYNLIENNTIQNMTFVGIMIGSTPRPRFNIIRNNHIVNVVQDGIYSGIKDKDDTILGLLIEGNEIHGSLISDGIESDGCYGENEEEQCTGVAGVIIRNNKIYDNAENNIDLKGTRYWVIENNILFNAPGNNDGGLKPRPQEDCAIPPCNNQDGGSNINKGANRYSKDIIIRNNIIYDGNSGVVIWDGYIVYNNTILNNKRTFAGPNQQACITDSCSRKPEFPGIYGPGEKAVIVNNIIGDNGFAVSRWYSPQWFIDHNLYYWTRPEPFIGLAHYRAKRDWQGFTLTEWQKYLQQSSEVSGNDDHSIVVSDPSVIFKMVGAEPSGNDEQFDFHLGPSSAAIDAGCPLTYTVKAGNGTHVAVKDARFFYDGYGITDGDFVIIGQNQPVRIKNVDYSTNTLVLAGHITWEEGAPVSLPFADSAPDIGARESTPLGPEILN